ncbi:MAG: hypothetical protein ACKVP4_08655 [Hyphomicrobium sp.]
MKISAAIIAVCAALLALGGPAVFNAEANQCVQQCRAAHNQCRMQTKGSPSCDGQLQACMDRCRSSR